MIPVTKLNGKTYILNALFIESIEETPDTMISMTNGKKFIVLESAKEVVELSQMYLGTIGLIGTGYFSEGEREKDV